MVKKTKRAARAQSSGGVDLAEVERLLGFMEKHRLEQFEYERDGVRILLKKSSVPAVSSPAGSRPTASSAQAVELPSEEPSSSGTPSASAVPAAASPAVEKTEDLHVIKSPIVGTFYWAPSPDADPFVTVGARVEPGQVLCIIEAMKLMNEIESDVAGEVAKIFPANGTPVEYGEPLFGIRPNHKK
jgi:acetyl-CoA carboxylase biotin carboxyl carrier protein